MISDDLVLIKNISLRVAKFFLVILEYMIRFLYLLCPFGLILLAVSLRDKMNTARVLNLHLNDKSVFQFIYPNTIIVLQDKDKMKNSVKKVSFKINSFLGEYKYILITALLSAVIVAICLRGRF